MLPLQETAERWRAKDIPVGEGVILDAANGILRSEGLRWERLGDRQFRIELGASRGLPACPNALQLQVLNAAEEDIELEVSFGHPQPRGKFDEYPHSVTRDFREFRMLEWQAATNGRTNRLRIPATGWPVFTLGMQCPLPDSVVLARLAELGPHPDLRVRCLGYSVCGRPVLAVTITAAIGKTPPGERWSHHVVNFHPGEGNARWRMQGMLEELLSARHTSTRERMIFEFIPALSPDGVANGWRRVNAQGVDMNRCFRHAGPDTDDQAHEANLYQTHLEDLFVAGQGPHAVWCMHTWPGLMEPLFDGFGKEWEPVQDTFIEFQRHWTATFAQRSKPPHVRPFEANPSHSWNRGIHQCYGITTVLVEGGGEGNATEHMEAGRQLLNIISTCPPYGKN